MAWVEKKQTAKGLRYIGRYRGPDNKKRKSPPMTSKTAARKWAEDQEAAMRRGDWIDPAKARATFREWCHEWWELYDYKPTTESGYYSILHKHLLPRWGDVPLRGIDPIGVEAWVRELRSLPKPDGSPYSEHHVQGIRRLFRTILEDAVVYGYLAANPAQIHRRGVRTAPPTPKREVHTDPYTALLFAERAAVLSGRDDEFLAATALTYTGMRWAELVGLKRRFCWIADKAVFVDVELVEVNGKFHETPPKTPASRRQIDLPEFLVDLLAGWLARDQRTHLYMAAGGGHPFGSHVGDRAWRPAADGWWPTRSNRHGAAIGDRPVLVDASAGFPGRPHKPAWPAAAEDEPFAPPRGRGVKRFPEEGLAASWLPLCRGLTPHDLRRSMRTWLADAGVPSNAAEARMGHEVPGVDAVYNVATEAQREQILQALEARWWAALARRRRVDTATPVAALQPWLDMAADRAASGDIQWDLCPPFAPQKATEWSPGRLRGVPDLLSSPSPPGSCPWSPCRRKRPLRPAGE